MKKIILSFALLLMCGLLLAQSGPILSGIMNVIPASGATVAFVNASTNTAASNANNYVSAPSLNVTSTNTLVVGCFTADSTSGTTVTSVTDSPAGNSFSSVTALYNAGGNNGATSLQIWAAYNVTGNSADVVTCNFNRNTSGGYQNITVLQFSGVLTSGFDQTATGYTSGASTPTVTSSSFTPGVSGEVSTAFAGFQSYGGAIVADTSPVYIVPSGGTDSTNGAGGEYLLNAATSSQTAAASTTGANKNANIVVATFKP